MNFQTYKKINKLIATFVAFGFTIVAFLGVHFTMQIDKQGKMANCRLLMQFEKECPMTVTQHISAWQRLFTATFQPSILTQLLLIVASLAFSFIAFRYFRFSQRISSSPSLSFQKTAPPFREDYLLNAFSDGVLRKRE